MLLGTELNFKICKLFCIKNSVEDKLDSVESLIWVLNFVLIKIAHFSRIGSEIFREGCFMAQFSWQVYSCISEVDIQERLLALTKSDFVELPHVLGHSDNLACFQSEGVGIWIHRPVQAINLVGLCVVRGDNSLARRVLD